MQDTSPHSEHADRERLSIRISRSPLDLLIAINGSDAGLAAISGQRLRLWGQALDIALRREHAKAVTRHWSYDLNRHIALKDARDRLRSELRARALEPSA